MRNCTHVVHVVVGVSTFCETEFYLMINLSHNIHIYDLTIKQGFPILYIHVFNQLNISFDIYFSEFYIFCK